MLKSRTVENMNDDARYRARRLWSIMTGTALDEEGNPIVYIETDSEYIAARDEYHSLFKHDKNFVKGVQPYEF